MIERYSRSIIAKKTKVIKIGKEISVMAIMINGKQLEQVKQFEYFGSTLTEYGICSNDGGTACGGACTA